MASNDSELSAGRVAPGEAERVSAGRVAPGEAERVSAGRVAPGEAGRVSRPASDTRASRATQPAPIIGLTTYLQRAQTGVWDTRAAYLPHVYFDAVTRAGGIAVLLPPQPVDDAITARVLDSIDGLIVTGGRDVDPARYGQARHPETDPPGTDRDDWELALLTGAIARELPFLGICRGAQVLNVALGGTLHQHLPDVLGSTRYQLGNAQFSTVGVLVDEASKVGHMVGGDDLTVEVYHHQAIDLVAPGLRVTARSQDDVIEAVELDSVPFGVGVQWHPEQTPEDLRLFAGLVEASRAYSGSSASSGSSGSSLSRSHEGVTRG